MIRWWCVFTARHDVERLQYDMVSPFQLDRKFRDEKRPRYGLLRCKEFWMKGEYGYMPAAACEVSAPSYITHIRLH